MSQKNKTWLGDFFFVFQLTMAWLFTAPQVRQAFISPSKMTITWSLFCSVFVLVNLLLAIGSYKEAKERRKARQVVIVYANWLLLWSSMFLVLCIKGKWVASDTIVSALIVISLTVLLITRWKGGIKDTLKDAFTRGGVSVISKGVPQVYIAYCIAIAGTNSILAGVTLFIGHLTVCARAFEIFLMARQDGWTRNNKALFFSEMGNEVTWCITTIAWSMYV